MGESLWSLVVGDVLEWQLEKPRGRGFHLGPNWFPMPRQWGYNLRPHNPASRKPLSVPPTAQFESSFEMTVAATCNCQLMQRRSQVFDKLIVLQRKLLQLLENIGFLAFFQKIPTIFFLLLVLLSSAAFTVLPFKLLAHFEGFMTKHWKFCTFLSLFRNRLFSQCMRSKVLRPESKQVMNLWSFFNRLIFYSVTLSWFIHCENVIWYLVWSLNVDNDYLLLNQKFTENSKHSTFD